VNLLVNGLSSKVLHLPEESDHPCVLSEEIDHESVDPRRRWWESWDGELVGRAYALAQVVSGQLRLSLLPLLLQLPLVLLLSVLPFLKVECKMKY